MTLRALGLALGPVPMGENPALLDPLAALMPAERTTLRLLDCAGIATRTLRDRRHWLLEGRRYTDRRLRRLVELGLAVETVQGTTIALRLTYAGRLVVERLRTRPIEGGVTIDD